MTVNNTNFNAYLEAELKKLSNGYITVKAGLFQRTLVRSMPCMMIRPNPKDEFCMPGIGPNYEIITDYEKQIQHARTFDIRPYFSEPLILERIQPGGYMLLNGHHRWAAMLQLGLGKKPLPVRVVNPTNVSDVREMIANSVYGRRVVMDLDEVILTDATDPHAANSLPFPYKFIYKERIKLSALALIQYLNGCEYEVWVYSAKYYSVDYIKRLFELYNAHVTGIVTGAAGKHDKGAVKKEIEQMIAQKYTCTVNVDNNSVLRIDNANKKYDEFALDGSADTWVKEVTDIFEGFKAHDE